MAQETGRCDEHLAPITGKTNRESHAWLRRCRTGSINLKQEREKVQLKNSMKQIGAVVDRETCVMLKYVAFRYPSTDDQKLIQIVDSAFADAARRSGDLLVCKKGCTQCCIGVFAINQLDAERLRRGFAELERRDAARSTAVRRRATEAWRRLTRNFPGDPVTGILDESEEGQKRFETFANEEPCPALNPDDGTCDLYEPRPMTCRAFGPPIQSEDGLGACELCYQGVPDKEIGRYQMIPDPDDLESDLLDKVEKGKGRRGSTIVAFCLASPSGT